MKKGPNNTALPSSISTRGRGAASCWFQVQSPTCVLIFLSHRPTYKKQGNKGNHIEKAKRVFHAQTRRRLKLPSARRCIKGNTRLQGNPRLRLSDNIIAPSTGRQGESSPARPFSVVAAVVGAAKSPGKARRS
jgi:hypothetical protein